MRSAGLRKAILGFVTTLVVAGAIILYLIFFVNERREARIERNFRILSRITTNIEAKAEKLSTTAANFIVQKLEKGATPKEGWQSPNTKAIASIKGDINASEFPITVGKNGFQSNFQGVELQYPVEDFLLSVLRSDAFDHYLLVDHKRQVLYHPEGLQLQKLQLADSIKLTAESHYDQIMLAGQQYHLFSTPFEVSNQKLVLVGMSSEERFNEATSSIPSLYIIIFSLLFIILLLSYPFIKIWLISPNERLKRPDVVAAVLALFFGTAIATLLLLDFSTYQRYTNGEIPAGLEATSQSIENAFEAELDSILLQLEIAQAEYADLRSRGGNKDRVVNSKNKGSYSRWLEKSPYPDFLNIAWIDASGQQQVKWSPDATNTRKVDVSGRSYFYEVIQNKFLYRDNQPFVLQSISSLNDTRSYASISIPNKNSEYPVITLTTRLESLHDPILSLGYGFALLNEEGKVLFHSDRQRNLQEIFTEEVSNSEELRSLIHSRNRSEFTANYHGTPQQFLLTPLNDWPLYLITYYDKGHINSVNAEILSFSLISLLVYSFPLMLLMLSIVYFRSHRSRLSFSNLRLQWLAPQPNYRLRYLLILLLLVILLILYYSLSYFSEVLLTPKLTQLSLALCLPLPVITGPYLLLQYNFRNQKHRIRFYFLLVFNLILLLSIAYLLDANVWMSVIFLSISGLVIFILSWIKNQKSLNNKVKGSFINWYRAAAVGVFLCISVPFIYASFSISHQTERVLYHRLAQLNLARQLSEKINTDGEPRDLQNAAFMHLSPPFSLSYHYDNEKFDRAPTNRFKNLYSSIRPKFNAITQQSNFLDQSSGQTAVWRWEQPEVMYFKPKANSNSSYLKIEYNLPSAEAVAQGSVLMLLGFLLLPLFLYFLIGSLGARVFIHSTFSNAVFIKIEDLLVKRPDVLLTDLRVFFFGVPKIGKTTFLLNFSRQLEIPLQKFDFASLEELGPLDIHEETKVVVIDHFEYGQGIEELELRKLAILEDLLTEEEVGIILISSFLPPFAEGVYSKNLLLQQRWLKLLGNFSKTFYQTSRKINDSTVRGLGEFEDLSLSRLLTYECRAFPFLQEVEENLKRGLQNEKGLDQPGYDELILKVQSIASFYYHELWSTCNLEEKYLLYDLAQDGLVNIRNTKVISSLISKGLVLQDGLLRVVNLSFRNFILTHADLTDIDSMEHSVNLKSSWRKIRLPLILLLVVMAAVLFYLQRDLLDEVTGMITAVGGVLVMLMRFSGSVKSSAKSGDPG